MNKDKPSILQVSLKIILYLLFYTVMLCLFIVLSRKIFDDDSSEVFSKSNEVFTVIIDAGHGGRDGGASSRSGVVEKDVNLAIAKYLEKYLSLSCVNVIMTRNEDVALISDSYTGSSKKRSDLLSRIETANKFPEALFISIHQNTYPSSNLTGMQIFYPGKSTNSKALADVITITNRQILDVKNKRAPKSSGSEIMVLDMIDNTGVLVECGFLSNEYEAKMLNDSKYQQKIAFVLYKSICDYFETERNYK